MEGPESRRLAQVFHVDHAPQGVLVCERQSVLRRCPVAGTKKVALLIVFTRLAAHFALETVCVSTGSGR